MYNHSYAQSAKGKKKYEIKTKNDRENRFTRKNSVEAYVVVNFSQNYTCKYNKKIQSAHFGASKKQLSL